MHLYLYARGKFEQVKLWESHVQSAYWKFRRINDKTGKEEIIIVQGALRPSILGAYEYVFPKEALAEVCSFFGIFLDHNINGGFSNFGIYSRHFCLRKIFGAKKIPKEIFDKAKLIPLSFTTTEFERAGANAIIPGVAIHPIGIKEDGTISLNGYTHEAL